MKLLDKFKKAFGTEPEDKPAILAPIDDPIKPGKVALRRLLAALRHGYRKPAQTRLYRKRKAPTRFIDGVAVTMSFRQARLHDIYTSMREAGEIRRSHRERQLERRAA